MSVLPLQPGRKRRQASGHDTDHIFCIDETVFRCDKPPDRINVATACSVQNLADGVGVCSSCACHFTIKSIRRIRRKLCQNYLLG